MAVLSSSFQPSSHLIVHRGSLARQKRSKSPYPVSQVEGRDLHLEGQSQWLVHASNHNKVAFDEPG